MFWISEQLFSETFLILRSIQQVIISNVRTSSCKAPGISSNFNETCIFSKKNVQIVPLVEILPVKAELFFTDRHDEAESRFSQFCQRPYKCLVEEMSNTTYVNTRSLLRSPATCLPCIPFTKYVSEYYSTIFLLYPTTFPLQHFTRKIFTFACYLLWN
jgi:hypothetical protein